ncbi:MAG: hypothetical protein FJ086_18160, partial [Deltaproteobacteria bacterium]|nr:hypothetical protein [Deltaproteobacteria bacterium]
MFAFHGPRLAGELSGAGLALSVRGGAFSFELEGAAGWEWTPLGAKVARVEDRRAGRERPEVPAYRAVVGRVPGVAWQVERLPDGLKTSLRFETAAGLEGARFLWRGAEGGAVAEGARAVRVWRGGAAVAESGLRCFQELDAGTVEVPCAFSGPERTPEGVRYRLLCEPRAWDAPVVVDPVLSNASDVGGSEDEGSPSFAAFTRASGERVELVYGTTLSPAEDYGFGLQRFGNVDLLLSRFEPGLLPSFQLYGTPAEEAAVAVVVRGMDYTLVSLTRAQAAPVSGCQVLGQPGQDGDWDGWLLAPNVSQCLWLGGPGVDRLNGAAETAGGLVVSGSSASGALASGALPQVPAGGVGLLLHCLGEVGSTCVPGVYAGPGTPERWAFGGVAELAGRWLVAGTAGGSSGAFQRGGVVQLAGMPDGGRLEASGSALLNAAFPKEVPLQLAAAPDGVYVAGAAGGTVTSGGNTWAGPAQGQDALVARAGLTAAGLDWAWVRLVGGDGVEAFRGALAAAGGEVLALGDTTSTPGTLPTLGRGGDDPSGQAGQGLVVQLS